MPLTSPIARAAAFFSAAAMAMPAGAAEMPPASERSTFPLAAAWDADGQHAANHRYRGYRRHRGVDAGDVLAGVVILGTVAAIASAASRGSRDRDYRDRDYRYRDDYSYRDRPYQYRPDRGDSRYADSSGINRAIDLCVREIERERRIESVDSVDRLAAGWRVEGAVAGGDGFTCRIGNDGRVDDIDYGQRRWNGASDGSVDRQWDDEAYARARSAREAQGGPAYPGGPVDGDYDPAYDEDRDRAGQAPDFGG